MCGVVHLARVWPKKIIKEGQEDLLENSTSNPSSKMMANTSTWTINMMPNWGLDHPQRLKQPEKISSTDYTYYHIFSIYNFINL